MLSGERSFHSKVLPGPMPILASGKFPILVGRIRQDLSDETGHSVSLFVCGDQLLKGAALNAVQIAQLFLD